MSRPWGGWARRLLPALVVLVAPALGRAQPEVTARLILDEPVDVEVVARGGAAVSLYQTSGIWRTASTAGVYGPAGTIWVASREICRAPCVARVGRSARYYVDGPGVVRADFRLPPEGERLRVDVNPGSFSGRLAAALVLGAGAVAAVVGMGLVAWVAAQTDDYHLRPWTFPTGYDPSALDGHRTVGAALFGVGLAAAIGGTIGVVLTRTVAKVRPARPVVALVPGGLAF